VIRVVIVADTRLYREGLAQGLDRIPRINVVATAASSDDALASIVTLAPDVVLIDATIANHFAIVRRAVAAAPGAKVVTLGVGDDDRDVLTFAEAGAIGYVSREGSLDDLVAAIESAARGEAVCPPRIAGALFRRVATLAPHGTSDRVQTHLTHREWDIIRLIDQGLANKEIAQDLRIEVATVKNHVHNILAKLQVHRRGEAAARVRGELSPARAGTGHDALSRRLAPPGPVPMSDVEFAATTSGTRLRFVKEAV
jgi:DNA-binding NarL/FixJ family response regulator